MSLLSSSFLWFSLLLYIPSKHLLAYWEVSYMRLCINPIFLQILKISSCFVTCKCCLTWLECSKYRQLLQDEEDDSLRIGVLREDERSKDRIDKLDICLGYIFSYITKAHNKELPSEIGGFQLEKALQIHWTVIAVFFRKNRIHLYFQTSKGNRDIKYECLLFKVNWWSGSRRNVHKMDSICNYVRFSKNTF